jgi:hypothetical protein
MHCIELSVRIVIKSPKVGPVPVLIFSITLEEKQVKLGSQHSRRLSTQVNVNIDINVRSWPREDGDTRMGCTSTDQRETDQRATT